jgi:hypothetical protein
MVYYNGQSWVFYAKGDISVTGGVRSPEYNPDNDSYVIWYTVMLQSNPPFSGPEVKLDLSETSRPEGFDQRDVSAVVFDGDLYVFASAGFGGSDHPVYYYKYDGTWTGPVALATGGGGHVNAVADADRVYFTLERGVDATLRSVMYTWDGTTVNGPYTVADGNGVPKMTKKGDSLFVVSIAPGATTINLHGCPASATPSTWTHVSDPIAVADAYVWDPSICADGGALRVFAAPSTAVPDRQWIVQTFSNDNGNTWSPVKTVSTGGCGEYWWEYWPVAFPDEFDGEGYVLFFTTEGFDGVYGDGMIGAIGDDWEQGNSHTFCIQPAIDMTQDGDTVLVGEGTWTGDGNRDLDNLGRSITLMSHRFIDISADSTIIDCGGSTSDPHYGIFFHDNTSETAYFNGFSVRNASSDFAAVRCSSSACMVNFCSISENDCDGLFGSNGSYLRVYNSSILGNSGRGVTGRYSSGAGVPEITNIEVAGCVMRGNTSHGVSGDGVETSVLGCEIAENDSAGVYTNTVSDFKTEVHNTLIRHNGWYGIFLDRLMAGTFNIHRCTIVSNQTGIHFMYDFPKGFSPDQYAPAQDSSLLTNTIVAYNREMGIFQSFPVYDYHLWYNDAYGNPDGDFVNMPYGPGDESGNFSCNPRFCDTTSHDYRLYEISPCTPENSPCGSTIGVSYVTGCSLGYTCGDANGSGGDPAVDIDDIVYLINYIFASGTPPVPLEAGDANFSGFIDIDDVVYLISYVFSGGPAPCEVCQ